MPVGCCVVTLHDVAKESGVAKATAARALGGYGYVSERTRTRVVHAATKLDYYANALARSMVKGRTNTLGVITADSANPFFAAMLRGIADVVQKAGHAMMLCNANEDPEKEDMFVRSMRENQVGGLILVPTGQIGHSLTTWPRDLPLILVDRKVRGIAAPAVIVDNRRGAKTAVAHLIRLGHRRIGTISAPSRIFTGRERLHGYFAALREAGVGIDKDLVKEGNLKEDSGYELAEQFLRMRNRPSALFIANSPMTIGALRALQRAGVRIPTEMAIVSFDDAPWAAVTTPPLTAVAQPVYAVGAKAAGILLQRIQGDAELPRRDVILKTQLIVRGSCGALQHKR
jgi:DNA-binding LacI/PurR family transcriptional regulator